jgi:hypothetical protein
MPGSTRHTLAAAGHVWMDRALRFAENPRMTRIALAVAGQSGAGDLVSLALKQNVPVTLVNYPGGHHAFEIVDEATRRGR